uniref:Phospholipase A2 n=1 Tax=Amazona collaria TaxID=241587 RepID=A0A8B9F0Y1_9PSIT
PDWRRERVRLIVVVLMSISTLSALVSKADCYVELKLPTASPTVFRTQVVDNSDNPEWNETFQYRIHTAVKNILELTLYDKDVLVSDELTSIVFDIAGMKLGQPLLRTFKLNPEVSPWLLPRSTVHPCLSLQGTVNKEEEQQGSCEVKVSVPGAYQKHLRVPLGPDNEDCETSFVFHVDKEICPELQVELEQTISDGMNDIEKHTTVLGLGTVPVNSLPIGQKVDRIVSLGEVMSTFQNCSNISWDLDIRLGFDLCKEEREFLEKRKKIVSEALRKTLHLKESPSKDEVPVVAVVGSGGGMRALTSFYGSLAGLQQLGLLDATVYLSGISGSTCFLYRFVGPYCGIFPTTEGKRVQVWICTAVCFPGGPLIEGHQICQARFAVSERINLTKVCFFILACDQEDPSKLSDQQEAVKWAQNPYPIYAAVNVRPNISSGDFAEWCEFTPYEVGFRKYGAFVRTEDFDSEFFMGRLVQKRPEPRICFLQGMWGSAFAASLDDICLKVVGIGLGFLDSFKDAEQPQFSQPIFIREVLQSPDHPHVICAVLLAESKRNESTTAGSFGVCWLVWFCGGFCLSGFLLCVVSLFFFIDFLAAGVERESEEEKSFGDFVIESKDSPYRTLNFTFEPYHFNRLVEVNRYNVLNSKDTLFRALNLALQRRKLK